MFGIFCKNKIQFKYSDLNQHLEAARDSYHPGTLAYLSGKNFRGLKKAVNGRMDAVTSTLDIVHKSLSRAPLGEEDARIKDSDLFFHGDIHAQLDLFTQNLFFSGVIDTTSNFRPNLPTNPDAPGSLPERVHHKSTVILGDTVNKGLYAIETVLYLNALQRMAEEKGLNFTRLMGNHEFWVLNTFPSSKEETILRSMLMEDCLSGRIKLAYADDKNKILSTHAGLRKSTLLKTLLKMSSDPDYKERLQPVRNQILKTYLQLKEKHLNAKELDPGALDDLKSATSSKFIYENFVFGRMLKLSDIADFMNRELKEIMKKIKETGIPLYCENKNGYLLIHENSVIHTRRKAFNTRHPERASLPDANVDLLIDPADEKYKVKPLQFVGHNCTNNGLLHLYGKKGGIMQNRATVFCDAGITKDHGGRQAFASFDSSRRKAYAIELCENDYMKPGLDDKNRPIALHKKKDFVHVRELRI